MEAQPRAGPITLSERILFIDILRGMALFGILAANMRAFFAPLDAYDNIGILFHSRADVLTQVFIDTFIQGKFISIFSFLFGLGFAIQMSRAQARGVRFLGFYSRRLLALALFFKYYLLDRVSPNEERYWKRIYQETDSTLGWWKPLEQIDRILLKLPAVRWLSWNVAFVAQK